MTWGSHCSQCGRADCGWVNGAICEGSVNNVVNFRRKDAGATVRSTPETARWRAWIEYRTEDGGRFDTHYFDEIAELHDIIEHGPHWETMVACTITLHETTGEKPLLTIEEAERL